MQKRTSAVTLTLVVIILFSLFAALVWLDTPPEIPEFYVGVEVAYTNANVDDVRNMVDKVRNYTNVFVIGSIELTFNETALNDSCDYIHNAGLKIVVLFTDATKYDFDTLTWLTQAQTKYGNAFLGLYRYDEPGGDQLENKEFRFVKKTTNSAAQAGNFSKHSTPYLESGDELYDDLTLAYSAGAKYIIVFNYPKIGPYGTLTENHFDALKKFWDYSQSNPQAFGSTRGNVAYVLPKDYGFGLRKVDDTIWGLFPADELSAKTWNDVNQLVSQYGAGFDILFDDEALDGVLNRYDRVN